MLATFFQFFLVLEILLLEGQQGIMTAFQEGTNKANPDEDTNMYLEVKGWTGYTCDVSPTLDRAKFGCKTRSRN